MALFPILAKSPDFWRPLMGFMDANGAEWIEPQFLGSAIALGDHFSAAGYAIMQRPNETQHKVINTKGDTLFELPPDHRPSPALPPDEHGIFGVTHQIDASNDSLWKIEGRDRVFIGETRHYGMRLDGSIAFEGSLSQSRHGRYVIAESPAMNAKKGLIDHTGDTILAPIYDAITLSRTSPFVTTLKDGVTNVTDLNGSPIFGSGFDIQGLTDLREVSDGLWVVPNRAKGRADVYDVETASKIGHLPLTFWSKMIPVACPTLSGGVACITHPSKGTTYYRPNGKPAMPGILGRPRWFAPDMRTGYFNDGRAAFKQGDLWGYLDMSGKHAIPPQFKSDLPFRNGLARVRYPADGTSWDRFSYVDRDGTVVWHQTDPAQ